MKPSIVTPVLAALLLAFLSGRQTRAVVTNSIEVTDTADEWTLEFSGSGVTPSIILSSLQSPSGWVIDAEGAAPLGSQILFSVSLHHQNGGPTLTVEIIGGYGIQLIKSDTAPHGTGTDLLELMINVAPGDVSAWGEFSGRIHALHRGGTNPPPTLPEGGATLILLGSGLITLGVLRRKTRGQ